MWAEKYIDLKQVKNAKGKLYIPKENALIAVEISAHEMRITCNIARSNYSNDHPYFAIISLLKEYPDLQQEVEAARTKPRDR